MSQTLNAKRLMMTTQTTQKKTLSQWGIRAKTYRDLSAIMRASGVYAAADMARQAFIPADVFLAVFIRRDFI